MIIKPIFFLLYQKVLNSLEELASNLQKLINLSNINKEDFY